MRHLLFLSAICCSAAPALAGEAARPGEPAVPSAREVPAGGAVISGAEIDRRGYRTLSDAARWTPGLSVFDLGPRGGGGGDGVAGRIARGLNAGVPAVWGDVPIGFDPRLHDMERVEVLLGPQGVSHGLGAMSGVVRYVPRKPDTRRRTFELHGEGFAQAHGDDPGGDLGVTANLPLVDGTLALRASVGMFHDPGFIDQRHLLRAPGTSHPEPAAGSAAAHLYGKADADTGRTLSARLSLLWKPTEDVEVVLSHLTQDLDAGGYRTNQARSYGTGHYESARRYTEPLDRGDRLWSLDIGWDMGPARLASTLGYTRRSSEGRRDQTDFLLRNFGIGGLLPADATAPEFGARPCDSADPTPFCAFSAFTRDEEEQEGAARDAAPDLDRGRSVGLDRRRLLARTGGRGFQPGIRARAVPFRRHRPAGADRSRVSRPELEQRNPARAVRLAVAPARRAAAGIRRRAPVRDRGGKRQRHRVSVHAGLQPALQRNPRQSRRRAGHARRPIPARRRPVRLCHPRRRQGIQRRRLQQLPDMHPGADRGGRGRRAAELHP